MVKFLRNVRVARPSRCMPVRLGLSGSPWHAVALAKEAPKRTSNSTAFLPITIHLSPFTLCGRHGRLYTCNRGRRPRQIDDSRIVGRLCQTPVLCGFGV